eukprot:355871-Chlamydomonas_euryale.AAC.1
MDADLARHGGGYRGRPQAPLADSRPGMPAARPAQRGEAPEAPRTRPGRGGQLPGGGGGDEYWPREERRQPRSALDYHAAAAAAAAAADGYDAPGLYVGSGGSAWRRRDDVEDAAAAEPPPRRQYLTSHPMQYGGHAYPWYSGEADGAGDRLQARVSPVAAHVHLAGGDGDDSGGDAGPVHACMDAHGRMDPPVRPDMHGRMEHRGHTIAAPAAPGAMVPTPRFPDWERPVHNRRHSAAAELQEGAFDRYGRRVDHFADGVDRYSNDEREPATARGAAEYYAYYGDAGGGGGQYGLYATERPMAAPRAARLYAGPSHVPGPGQYVAYKRGRYGGYSYYDAYGDGSEYAVDTPEEEYYTYDDDLGAYEDDVAGVD